MSLEKEAIGGAVILNVDDNEPGRYAKSRILKRAGFQVYDAASGAEGLELAERHAPDLVLLDVNLPDVSGIDVCRRLKEAPESAAVMVLQISAHAIAASQASAALNNGADCYLMEPVDPDVLVATVRALLRLRRAERAVTAANAELLRSNDYLRQFAAIASHDLKEPLRNIITFASMLERTAGARLNEGEQKFLTFIHESGMRMSRLIDDLLTYSQLNREERQSHPVRLLEVFEWSKANLQQRMLDSAAKVTCGELPTVIGDEGQLRHLMQNLLSNALKYHQPNVPAEIELSAQQSGREWVVSVRDNGVGIPEKYREAIFMPFKRLHGREIPGTGIGLALCRRIVEAHRGRIWVEENPAGGSVFRFTIPVDAN